MEDEMSLSPYQIKFAKMIHVFETWLYNNGYEFTYGEAYRTQEQQDIYFTSGKSKMKHSKHQDRLARDYILYIDGVCQIDNPEAYRKPGEYWESLGGRWGGRFGLTPDEYGTKIGWDANHFEYGNII